MYFKFNISKPVKKTTAYPRPKASRVVAYRVTATTDPDIVTALSHFKGRSCYVD